MNPEDKTLCEDKLNDFDSGKLCIKTFTLQAIQKICKAFHSFDVHDGNFIFAKWRNMHLKIKKGKINNSWLSLASLFAKYNYSSFFFLSAAYTIINL